MEKLFGVAGRMFHKPHKGVLVLENVTEAQSHRGVEPMVQRNKYEIISVEEALAVMETLARFHGILWIYSRGTSEDEIDTCSKCIPKQEILDCLMRPKGMLFRWLLERSVRLAVEAVIPLIHNQMVESEARSLVGKIERYN